MIDITKFINDYRASIGKIRKTETVNTLTAILYRADADNLLPSQTAYMIATALHEANVGGFDFYPIIERGGYSYMIKKYWNNSTVRRWLGNKTAEDAWTYRGRGLVQLTGRANYQKFGIATNPDKALELDTAVHILFSGMRNGIFTGKKLITYVNTTKTDYYNARKVINGLDKADVIAGFATKIETILRNQKIT